MAIKLEYALGYPALTVANTLVQLAHAHGISISGPQVQKLIYFAHGSLLARHGRPLVKEEFAAWRHGPLLESLYHDFKLLGAGPLPGAGWPMTRLGQLATDDGAAQAVLQETLRTYHSMPLAELFELSRRGAWACQPATARTIPHAAVRQHAIAHIRAADPAFGPPPMQTPAMALVPRETLERLARYLAGGHYEPRTSEEGALAAEILQVLAALPKPTPVTHLKTGNAYYRLGSVRDCTNSRDGAVMAQYVPADQPYIEPFVRDHDEFEAKFAVQ